MSETDVHRNRGIIAICLWLNRNTNHIITVSQLRGFHHAAPLNHDTVGDSHKNKQRESGTLKGQSDKKATVVGRSVDGNHYMCELSLSLSDMPPKSFFFLHKVRWGGLAFKYLALARIGVRPPPHQSYIEVGPLRVSVSLPCGCVNGDEDLLGVRSMALIELAICMLQWKRGGDLLHILLSHSLSFPLLLLILIQKHSATSHGCILSLFFTFRKERKPFWKVKFECIHLALQVPLYTGNTGANIASAVSCHMRCIFCNIAVLPYLVPYVKRLTQNRLDKAFFRFLLTKGGLKLDHDVTYW